MLKTGSLVRKISKVAMFLTLLPFELRDRVYKLVLVALPKHQPVLVNGANRVLKLMFLRVCRQVYQEARHIPYRYNGLMVREQDVVCFLSIIQQKNMNELKRLTILGRPIHYQLNSWALIRRCANLKSLQIEVNYDLVEWDIPRGENVVTFDLNGRLEVCVSNWIILGGPEIPVVTERQVRACWARAETADSCITGLLV